jgi:hypothetical protein
MIEANNETTTPSGSERIQGRRSAGSAVSSREVTRPDAMASCGVRAGQENTNDGTSSEEQKENRPVPRLVERKTELRGLGIAPSRGKKSALRRKTEQDLKDPDPEVPYTRFEAAAQSMVCALMERQDRMNEEIFEKINDLGYRQDDLEATVEDIRQGKRSG